MTPPKFTPGEESRASAIFNLAAAIGHLHVDGYTPSRDLLMLLEHKLRSYLREGECPLCPSCQLEVLLTQTESPAQPASSGT